MDTTEEEISASTSKKIVSFRDNSLHVFRNTAVKRNAHVGDLRTAAREK
jgi:hypothetical protein